MFRGQLGLNSVFSVDLELWLNLKAIGLVLRIEVMNKCTLYVMLSIR